MTVLVAERGFDIGQKVRELRRAQALTQEELGELANVHGTTISDLERGAGRASAKTTKRLARALGVEVRELTAGARELPPDEPGLTTENEAKIGQAKREKAERDEETRLQGEKNASDTGDRRA